MSERQMQPFELKWIHFGALQFKYQMPYLKEDEMQRVMVQEWVFVWNLWKELSDLSAV